MHADRLVAASLQKGTLLQRHCAVDTSLVDLLRLQDLRAQHRAVLVPGIWEMRLERLGCKAPWAAALVPGGPRLLIATGEVLGCCFCPGVCFVFRLFVLP